MGLIKVDFLIGWSGRDDSKGVTDTRATGDCAPLPDHATSALASRSG